MREDATGFGPPEDEIDLTTLNHINVWFQFYKHA